MTSRPVLFVVMTLVLLHQLVAGVFAGGTILCIGTGGIALQPMGMTCCTVHGPQLTADACCADDTTKTCQIAPPADCQGCTDHLVSLQPMLPPHAMDLALPPSTPVLIAVMAWPSAKTERVSSTARYAPARSPPPLQFLATVVLRI